MQKDPEKDSLLAHVLADRRYAAMLGLGFSAGIPFLLVYVTQSAWLSEAKVPIDLIPYRGAAPALQDIAGGHVDLFFATPQSVVQQVKAGQIKAYGITATDPGAAELRLPDAACMEMGSSSKANT